MESHAFMYAKNDGKLITMSCQFVTEEIMGDRERLYDLVDKLVSASQKKK